MKCTNCGVDNNLKDRTANQGRCKNCRQPFAFEPTTMKAPLKFTDAFYAKLIQDLSGNDTLFFTESQLYYFFNRRLDRKISGLAGCLSSLGILSIIFALFNFIGQLFGFGFGLLAVGIVLTVGGQMQRRRQLHKQPKKFHANWSTFTQWNRQWQRAKGAPQRQLQPVRQQLGQVEVSPQVTDYSFDRVVVCEHDDIAQMLIANNLHFEHNCVVISVNGYPSEIFETVMTMLKRNPNLSVYALHDASPDGLGVPTVLRQPQWFPDPGITIYDLGLLPRHALSLKNPFVIKSDASAQQAKQLPENIIQNLSEAERRWLMAGNVLALAAFGPKRILQVISQGIGRIRLSTASAGDNEMYWTDSNDSLIVFSDGFG